MNWLPAAFHPTSVDIDRAFTEPDFHSHRHKPENYLNVTYDVSPFHAYLITEAVSHHTTFGTTRGLGCHAYDALCNGGPSQMKAWSSGRSALRGGCCS